MPKLLRFCTGDFADIAVFTPELYRTVCARGFVVDSDGCKVTTDDSSTLVLLQQRMVSRSGIPTKGF